MKNRCCTVTCRLSNVYRYGCLHHLLFVLHSNPGGETLTLLPLQEEQNIALCETETRLTSQDYTQCNKNNCVNLPTKPY